VWAASLVLTTSGCSLAGDVRHELHLRSLHCSDGLPVRLLQNPRCPDGLCGYTCAPDRWDDRLPRGVDQGVDQPGGSATG
jgi:hypothetical protein